MSQKMRDTILSILWKGMLYVKNDKINETSNPWNDLKFDTLTRCVDG